MFSLFCKLIVFITALSYVVAAPALEKRVSSCGGGYGLVGGNCFPCQPGTASPYGFNTVACHICAGNTYSLYQNAKGCRTCGVGGVVGVSAITGGGNSCTKP